MNKKWDWLPTRLTELKMSQSDFGAAIGWPATRVSEMINNIPVDSGGIRNIPQPKLKKAAQVLKVKFMSLWEYNVGESDTVQFLKPGEAIDDEMLVQPGQEETVALIMQAIEEFLNDNNLSLSPSNKAKIFVHICSKDWGSVDQEQIKQILSGMLFANSEIFQNIKR